MRVDMSIHMSACVIVLFEIDCLSALSPSCCSLSSRTCDRPHSPVTAIVVARFDTGTSQYSAIGMVVDGSIGL